MISASPGGKSEKGGTSRRKLFERRMIATLFKRRASCSIAALMKWVVPTVTLTMFDVESCDRSSILRMAVSIPLVTSGVVGVL
jgi:hypothetical protein